MGMTHTTHAPDTRLLTRADIDVYDRIHDRDFCQTVYKLVCLQCLRITAVYFTKRNDYLLFIINVVKME